MNRIILLFFCAAFVFSCKKDKTSDPAPEPEPVKTGTVNITVLTYDSLGDPETNQGGVNVKLYQTSFSANTNAAGFVSFSPVPYGQLLPVLQKDYYDGAPVRLTLNSDQLSASIPCAKFCAYRIQSFTAFIVNPDSIPISFNLDRPIPAGKTCKLAIMFSESTINLAATGVMDTVLVSSQVVQKLNIAQLPNFKNALSLLDKDKSFHISVVPVSYGLYYSNVLGKQILLGENPYFPNDMTFNKNW